MKRYQNQVAALIVGLLAAFLGTAPLQADCAQDAYKTLAADNQKCYAAYGRNGEKDRTKWKKCKYNAKDKYHAARKKCK